MNESPTARFPLSVDWGARFALVITLGGAQLIIALVLLYAALGKIMVHGFQSHVMHFTNWSWTLQIFFYFATIGAPVIQFGLLRANSGLGQLTRTLLVLLFFPLNGIVWVVVVTVQVLLGTEASFLADLLNELPPTLVMLGNDVFHFWPVIFFLLYALAYAKIVFYAHNHTLNTYRVLANPGRTTLYIIYQAYGGAAIALLMYSIIFDPQEVYKTDIHILTGVVVAAITLTIFNLLPILIIFGLLGVGSRTAYSERWLFTNYADPAVAPYVKKESP